jgi:alkanesulfonate monooxygenase SsuD/methylene tetrahydromethanopterin reductase-like flavin-dependent oxidoreductase (luciferase family)
MRISALILPEFPWSTARKVWRHAEELGFDHAWTYDHLAWRSLRDSPWFGAIPTLSAAATATKRIRLGTLVASPNFRHPVPFAKELITLDDISAGRLTLGIGAGSTDWDATMLGQVEVSRRERAERFAEFVELLDRLLREEATSFKGKFYSAHEARNYPGCTQRIPFAIAASGVRGMRLAATYAESWVTTGDRTTQQPLGAVEGVRVVREQMARLDEVSPSSGVILPRCAALW